MLPVSDSFKQAIKSPARTIRCRVNLYLDGDDSPPLQLNQEDITDINGLEEAFAESDSPIGVMSSNEITITIGNYNGIYTPTNIDSPYYGKMHPNISVEVLIGVQIVIYDTVKCGWLKCGTFKCGEYIAAGAPGFEYISLGKYKTTDWQASSSTGAVLTCNDSLYDLMQSPVPMLPILLNTTLYDMFEQLFIALGLSVNDYSIDETLKSILVPTGWYPSGIVKDALNELCTAGLCMVIIGRDNKLLVRSLFNTGESIDTIDDETMIKEASIPQDYSKIYAGVEMDYNQPDILEPKTIFKADNIVVDTGITILNNLTFSEGPMAMLGQVYLKNAEDCTIQEIACGTWGASITVNNTGTKKTIGIAIIGYTVGNNKVTVSNTTEVPDFVSDKKILPVSSHLIQDAVTAQANIDKLNRIIHDPSAFVRVSYRGNPAYELLDTITAVDPSDKIGTVDIVIVRNILKFDGGLDGELVGIKKQLLISEGVVI